MVRKMRPTTSGAVGLAVIGVVGVRHLVEMGFTAPEAYGAMTAEAARVGDLLAPVEALTRVAAVLPEGRPVPMREGDS